MAISFNTGTTGAGTTTIPAGVLAGDVMLLVVNGFSNGVSPVVSVSSTGTAFTQIGPQVQGGSASGFSSYGAIFYAVASATDAGKVITASITGGGGPSFATALAAYTGASNSAPIDVSNGAGSGVSPLAFPTLITGQAGDWAISLSAYGEGSGGGVTVSSGTLRENHEPSFGVGAGIWDSNGSVGGSGTSIGGNTVSSAAGSVWLTAFTVGLAPPSAATGGTVQPRATVPAPRRRLARAVAGFTPVATSNAAPAPPAAGAAPHPQTIYRRGPARAYVRFTPVTTANQIPIAVAAPRQQPAPAPRRKPARAYTQFTPVATVNAPPPPPKPPAGTAFSDEAREFKRWLIWEA